MNDTAPALQGECPRCGEMARLRARSFSDQAISALVAWQEVTESAALQPICDECYGELREVLIDRHEELGEGALPVSAAAPQKLTQKAAPKPVPVTAGKKTPAGKAGKKAG